MKRKISFAHVGHNKVTAHRGKMWSWVRVNSYQKVKIQ